MGENHFKSEKIAKFGKIIIPDLQGIVNNNIRRVWQRKFLEVLSRNYWWILPLVGLSIMAMETYEHFPRVRFVHLIYLSEITAVTLLLLIVGIVTRMLLSALAERNQALNILRLKHEMAMDLSSCQDMLEFSDRMQQLASQVVPSSSIELALYEKNQNGFVSAERMVMEEVSTSTKIEDGFFDTHSCLECLMKRGLTTQPLLHPCEQDKDPQSEQECNHYCLPLLRAGNPNGLLRLSTSSVKQLTSIQSELLEDLSTTMANMIHTVLEKKAREAEAFARKIQVFQMDIARDLHDSVVQNLGYLRMKLDHFTEADILANNNLSDDLRGLSKVANETYELMRSLLVMLQTGINSDLMKLISQHSRQVAERSGISIQFRSVGQADALHANAIRQLFYIYREALNNIEKHAHASEVSVGLEFHGDGTVSMEIRDNGRGFNPRIIPPGSHYGLQFMRERAEQLHGSFSVASKVHAGTSILVRVPCLSAAASKPIIQTSITDN